MSWQEGVGIIAVVIGLIGALLIVGQRPSFWIEFGWRVFVKLRPLIWAYLAKRMTPEEEAEMQREQRAGRGDEWLRKWHRRKRG